MMRLKVVALGVVLAVALAGCLPKKTPVLVEAPAGNWTSLFNGKDLSEWTVKIAGHDVGDNYANTFRVEDGVLKVSYAQYDKFGGRFGSIFTKQKYSHYWIRVEYRFLGDLVSGAPSWAYRNSGIQLHSQAPESMRKAQEFPVSVEFDLVGDRRFGSHPTGDVCENGTRVKIDGDVLMDKCSKLSQVAIQGDEWVTALAEVQGGTLVRQIVNGQLVVQYTDVVLNDADPDAKALLGTTTEKNLSSGYISLQSNGHPVEFRRIEILPLE